MVQVSLKKVGCLAGLLALVLLVGAFIVLFTDIGRHDHAANARKQPDPLDVAELHRFAPPDKVVTLDSAQKAELRRVFADIVQAYSNRQVEVLREWRRKLPERVELISRNDFDDITRPLSRIVYDETHVKRNKKLCENSRGEEYRSVAGFERYADTLMAIVLVYGDVRLRRRNLGGLFEELEALMFARLKSYRDDFRTVGRTDMERAAERALAEWIDQIESGNGYTKTCVVMSVASYRVWGDRVMEECSQTWEEVSQNAVRQFTYGLILAGYTPKWLDEFKNIPRHAAPREEEQPKK